MKNKNLALVAVLFTISVIMAFANGPTPPVYIDTDQIIDGAVDIIKTTGIADASLSNVNPATGRTALGLDLRLDTINASFTGDIDVTGFSRLGELSTGIKMKVLKGTTGSTAGSTVTVNHLLTGGKILGFTCKVADTVNRGFPPAYGGTFDYSTYHNSDVFAVTISASGTSILGKPFTICVVYTE